MFRGLQWPGVRADTGAIGQRATLGRSGAGSRRDAAPGRTAMNLLSRISVRAKLALLVGAACIGLVAVAAAGAAGTRLLSQGMQRTVQTDFAAVQSVGDLRAHVGNLRRFEKDLFLHMGDEATFDRYLASWRKTHDAARADIEALQPRLEPGARESLARLAQGLDGYRRGLEGIVEGIRVGRVNDPWKANQEMEAHKAAVRAADQALGEIVDAIAGRVAAQAAAFEGIERRALAASLGIAAALLVGLGVLAWAIAGRITRPLAHAAEAVERVAAGDLAHPVVAEGRDEIGRVVDAIARMQRDLGRTVGTLRQGIDAVATASAQIAQGSLDLSGRTEQQAASVQQSASSMEQLGDTVRQTASHAREAQALAGEASHVAERGGAVVADVVTTMSAIQDASRRIAEINGVIDGIAFQTNILALNAAVEAARAGEAGRGFAVVAAEVRALAQRSAEAARQIKSLIAESVDRVDSGHGLVQSAGATMQEIVAQVHAVRERLDRIRDAADEQSGGISQVGVSVADLDRTTQQNAALVEESSAAAESLKQQAAALAAAVSAFRLGNAG
jgi:methyl-accepting chemotaxis protein